MRVHERPSKFGISVSSLPDDLLQRILGLLPLQSKLACRCVCKSWKSILSTDHNLVYTTNSAQRSPGSTNARILLTTKGPYAYTLDPSSNLWHRLPKPSWPGASVLAVACGLVCIGNQVSECRSLLILNLASNSWKLLPNMLHVGLLHKVTMAMDPSSHSYVIVVTGEDTAEFRGRGRYRLRTEVYDSVSGCWRMAGDALPDAKFGLDPGVWCGGCFFCVTELPYGLTVFNLSIGRWMELDVEMPAGITVPSVVSCNGQLMMVGIQEDADMEFNHDRSLVPGSLSPAALLRRRLRLPRSWSWSGRFQMWTSSQFRSTLAAWPSIATWTVAPSAVLKSSSSPSLPSPSPPSQSQSLLSLSLRSLSMSRLLSPSRSPPSPPQAPQSFRKRSIKLWKLLHGKQWRVVDRMPEDMCAEFMSHLTPRTGLVCAGVGGEVCITSHQSPNAVVFDLSTMNWRYAASDPLFPRDRDAHLLGFTIQPDCACAP